jgi:Ran GTPase-activating protein 1
MTEPATTEFSIKGKTLKFDTAEDVKEYIVQLRKMDDLESVVLGGNTFGIEAAKAIANELKNKKNLKVDC